MNGWRTGPRSLFRLNDAADGRARGATDHRRKSSWEAVVRAADP